MNFDHNMPKKLKEYFNQNPLSDSLKLISLIIFRKDGVVLYSSNQNPDIITAGALMGGVWQAACALSKLSSFGEENHLSENDGRYFRFGFDTSSKGVYILPFKIHSSEYYISMLYKDQINPAVMKAKLRELASSLEHTLVGDVKVKTSKQEDLLFSNITDEEMDKLFSFTGSK